MDNTMVPSPAPEDQTTMPPPASLSSSDVATWQSPGPDARATPTPDGVTTQNTFGDARAPAGYVISRELGRGGMGVVYLARDVALHRPCALKMILAGVHSGDVEMDRFRTEAQAIARLQHPGIVQVFDIGEHDGKPYIALEYCSGGSLDAKLAKNPLTPKQAAGVVKTVAEAVHALHQAHVIHRDLKPANVLLTEKGDPKVTDFGLAKKMDEQGATRTGCVMGTPSYMPPEQAEGKKEIGPAVDVYSLGAILYECLTSRPPFRAATPLDTIMQVLTLEPVSVRQLNAQVPVDLETICAKCLQKDSKKRYATAQDLAEDLGRYLAGEPILARPVGTIERGLKWVRRNALVATVLGVLAVLIAGVIVASYFAFTANKEVTVAHKEKERAEGLAYAGQLALAQSAFAEGNLTSALEHLDECQWNLRGWEHRHLWTGFNAKQTLLGHTNQVTSVLFSLDGKRIVTGSRDGTAKVWDVEKGQEVLTLKGHKGPVTGVAISPDGKHIVTGSADRTAKVWETAKGTEVLSLTGHTRPVTSVAFSPDGKRIATGCGDGTAKLWDAKKGQDEFTLRGHTQGVTSIAFSPNGSHLVTGSEDRTAKVWDMAKGTAVLALTGHRNRVTSVAFNPNRNRILTGSDDKTAKVWNAANGTEVLSLKGHKGPVTSVAFSPDGQRIVTGSEDDTAKVWEAGTDQELLSLKGHTDDVTSVAFSPDGQRIVTGSLDKTAKVWDAVKGQEVVSLIGHSGSLNSVAISPDGKRIVTCSGDADTPGEAKVWDAKMGQEILFLRGLTSAVLSVAFSLDGKRIVTGSQDGTATVWDAKKGTEMLTLKGHSSRVTSVAFSPDGKHIVTGSGGSGKPGEAKLWDAEKGKAILTFKGLSSGVTCLAFSPDGKRIVTGSGDAHTPGEALVWDAKTGQQVLSLKGHTSGITSVAFNHDGAHILAGSWDRTAKVWDAKKGTEILTLKGHAGAVTSVAFSPDGKRIVTGGEGGKKQENQQPGEIKIWDAETGHELLSLKGHTCGVTCLAFSLDGKHLVTGSTDKTAKIWDGEKNQEILSLKGNSGSVSSLAFSGDGKRLFVWDDGKKVQAWSVRDGQPVEPTNPPPAPRPGPAVAPDGHLRAEAYGDSIAVFDPRRVAQDNNWPLPDVAERRHYHAEQADRAEKEKQWFAMAFHLGRLLLDTPKDEELKRRREEALRLQAVVPMAAPSSEKVP